MTYNIKKTYQAIASFLIPLMFISTTALIVSNDLANGTVSGKYFWFYLSIGLIVVSSVIIAILKKRKAQFTVVNFFILIFVLTSLFTVYLYDNEFSTKQIKLKKYEQESYRLNSRISNRSIDCI